MPPSSYGRMMVKCKIVMRCSSLTSFSVSHKRGVHANIGCTRERIYVYKMSAMCQSRVAKSSRNRGEWVERCHSRSHRIEINVNKNIQRVTTTTMVICIVYTVHTTHIVALSQVERSRAHTHTFQFDRPHNASHRQCQNSKMIPMI